MASKMMLSLALLAPLSTAFPLLGRTANEVVTGSLAVTSINNSDGVGAGSTTYTTYTGDGSTAAGWPAQSQWVSFEDMFNAYQPVLTQSCGWNSWGADNSASEIQSLYNGIQSIAQSTSLDHRFIFATILQESKGCVRVITTDNGVRNPGLMQSHNGAHTCNDATVGGVLNPCPDDQISGMIADGAAGTADGDGLAALLDDEEGAGYGGAQAFYRVARTYNSGSVAADGNLGEGLGATDCYASDIANRLVGWVDTASPSTCTL